MARSFKKNLVLIGGRGSGKSSIARRVHRAEKRFSLFCLDALIRYEAGGMTIPALVEARGWHVFRDLEAKVTEKVGALPGGALIDCGGGVIVDLDERGEEIFSERKIASLKRHGVIVYLERPLDYLIERIEGDSTRPSLSATKSFRQVMRRRAPMYERAADHVIRCKRRPKADLVDELLDYSEHRLR